MKIGVIAENTNDFVAIAKLLKTKYTDNTFVQIAKNITGSQLDDKNNNHVLLNIIQGIQAEEPDFLLYIRDLDALMTDDTAEAKIKTLTAFFKKIAKQRPKKSIFMLNIYELEALILADFDAFKVYHKNTDWVFDATVAADTKAPKEALKKFTKYNEGNARDIFPTLNIAKIAANHRFFADFMQDFDKMIGVNV